MKKFNIAAAAAMAAVISLGLSACSATASVPDIITVQQADATANTVTVQASEKVKVVPDTAEIIFAVLSQAADAKECQNLNAAELDKVLKLLEAQGIDSKSIQTSNYGLNPIYDWKNGQKITGYDMKTNLTVSDLPIDQAGVLISACVEAGVNNIERVTYLAGTYDKAYQEALEKAIKAAREKASAMAAADGRTISAMIQVDELGSNQQVRYTGYENGAGMAKEAVAVDSIAVSPGQLDVEAHISASFSLQ